MLTNVQRNVVTDYMGLEGQLKLNLIPVYKIGVVIYVFGELAFPFSC